MSKDFELDAGTACPHCDALGLAARYETQKFIYGDGDDAAELSVDVPVWSCAACGFEFTDDVAEARRHDAVCRHLGRLTPDEIRAIRAQYHLSQEGLATLAKIGVASIKRWELGNQIQVESLDRYLRLLAFKENALRVTLMPSRGVEHQVAFRTQLTSTHRQAAASFRLRTTAVVIAEVL